MPLAPTLLVHWRSLAIFVGTLTLLTTAVITFGVSGFEFPRPTSVEPYRVLETCPAHLPQRYVPPAALDPLESGPSWAYAWLLEHVDEPTLSCGIGTDAIRFVWQRSFHPPVVIRVGFDNADAWLTAIALGEPADGAQLGPEQARISKPLSAAQTSKLMAQMQDSPIANFGEEAEAWGLDGSTWLFEQRSGWRYYAVSRWSPRQGGLRDLGMLLVDFSELEIPQAERY